MLIDKHNSYILSVPATQLRFRVMTLEADNQHWHDSFKILQAELEATEQKLAAASAEVALLADVANALKAQIDGSN